MTRRKTMDERAEALRSRSLRASRLAREIVTNCLEPEDVRNMLPDLRERLVEMAQACEAFVRAWEGRAK